VRRLLAGASLAEVARACEVTPLLLRRWRRALKERGSKAFSGHTNEAAEESNTIAELERKIGRQAMEIDFLERCLQQVEEQRKVQASTTHVSSTPTSKKK
jgi:transposase-like protein